MGRPPRPCGRCPMWKNGDCLIRGIRRVATAPSCEYGRSKMTRAYQARRRKKRTGA